LGNSKKRKKKKKVGYNSLGMIAIALVVLVLLGGLMLKSNDLKERLTGYDAKAATLQQQIEDEQTRTEEIDKLKKYMETDEYAEEVAREKLGLVKDNETVFKKQQ
jgi:cell division protein DivIC